ncbi:MAG: 2-polyprenyl-3-methyl-5-hydroxy-6-metoxy-1,4-benzoquinol methylase [Limisphaerales bacterium]|jgi:2-polyprenyl-3-methyl-5-hydroxy-6-metoxy-1,4-benzoquinol methylase
MRMENMHDNCLVCGSAKLSGLEEYYRAYLCSCDNCGFVFARRVPSNEELVTHYEGYGRNDYLSPITIKRYNEILDEFEPYRKTNRLLDVGCGIGYFLEVAKERGWEVYGTEYTDEAVNICRSKGVTMHSGMLDPSNYDPASFDILTSFEVIEHINNPKEEIVNSAKLLRDGGLYYLTTPNFNSLLRYKLKSDYNVICYPEHLSYYTPKTIRKLFNSVGFQTKSVQTTGISLTRLRTSSGNSNQAFISESSDDEKIRNAVERNSVLQLAKSTANFTLTQFGVGDSLKAKFEWVAK